MMMTYTPADPPYFEEDKAVVGQAELSVDRCPTCGIESRYAIRGGFPTLDPAKYLVPDGHKVCPKCEPNSVAPVEAFILAQALSKLLKTP